MQLSNKFRHRIINKSDKQTHISENDGYLLSHEYVHETAAQRHCRDTYDRCNHGTRPYSPITSRPC